jgi:hypothetical protein
MRHCPLRFPEFVWKRLIWQNSWRAIGCGNVGLPEAQFFSDVEVPLKWEFGVAPPVAQYMDRISLTPGIIEPVFPRAEVRVTKRN